MLWLSEETEELAIQDSLCTDTQLQFTATNVTCEGLTVARKRPIIHGDRKLMRYSTLIRYGHGLYETLPAIEVKIVIEVKVKIVIEVKLYGPLLVGARVAVRCSE